MTTLAYDNLTQILFFFFQKKGNIRNILLQLTLLLIHFQLQTWLLLFILSIIKKKNARVFF